ncbi:hypothetical protein M011DRAFT_38178 [Sporormia fimetaria CBS 119925]|uniref:Uncharacterized protein n=1 Tax=Sporormia fimetaria CBS 119925 TaxID=1340428 RepID=A0A6A6VB08_9PLEO|nr:hypothetical protein M011DRAFT_38178 [Sporormia fimetaria CBS 119925]
MVNSTVLCQCFLSFGIGKAVQPRRQPTLPVKIASFGKIGKGGDAPSTGGPSRSTQLRTADLIMPSLLPSNYYSNFPS